MVPIKEALKIIRDQQIQLKTENRLLSDCLGYSLSKEILAPFDMTGLLDPFPIPVKLALSLISFPFGNF